MRLSLIPLLCLLACGDKVDDVGEGSDGGSDGGSADDGGDGGTDSGSTGDDGTDSGGTGDDGTGDDGTGDDGGDDTAAEWCEEQPTVVYNNFGKSFMTSYCQGCHASAAVDRYGAPESVTFDTVDEVWAWQERILARSTGDAPSMPPSGGVQDDDRYLLLVWLSCADPGT